MASGIKKARRAYMMLAAFERITRPTYLDRLKELGHGLPAFYARCYWDLVLEIGDEIDGINMAVYFSELSKEAVGLDFQSDPIFRPLSKKASYVSDYMGAIPALSLLEGRDDISMPLPAALFCSERGEGYASRMRRLHDSIWRYKVCLRHSKVSDQQAFMFDQGAAEEVMCRVAARSDDMEVVRSDDGRRGGVLHVDGGRANVGIFTSSRISPSSGGIFNIRADYSGPLGNFTVSGDEIDLLVPGARYYRIVRSFDEYELFCLFLFDLFRDIA